MSLKNKKVLVTCGPTWVPIDSVRVISNLSSGQLGQTIARDFAKAGARVTLAEGPVANPLKSNSVRIRKFSYFEELSGLVRDELRKDYDICIHAAAVADFKLKRPVKTKIRSGPKTLRIDLVPTKKIIQQIKRMNPGVFLVGFKLEPGINKTNAVKITRSLFKRGMCDLVVANSLKNGKYTGLVLGPKGKIFGFARSRAQLSKSLTRTVDQNI